MISCLERDLLKTLVNIVVLLGLPIVGFIMGGGAIIGIATATYIPKLPGK